MSERRAGNSRLVYDKATRTIKTERTGVPTLTQASFDVRIVVTMLDGLLEATGESLDPEDAALLAEIKRAHAVPEDGPKQVAPSEDV